MTFAEVLPVLTAGKIAKLTGWEYRLRDGNGDIEWRYPGNAWKRYDSSMRRLLLASDWEVPDSHHPKCARVPGFCGDRCRPRMTPERFAEVFDAAISVGCHGSPPRWQATTPLLSTAARSEETTGTGSTLGEAIEKLAELCVEQARENLEDARSTFKHAEERWRRIESAANEMTKGGS